MEETREYKRYRWQNDHAALLKLYISVHSDSLNLCQEISAAWNVAFLEEPSSYLLDMRERHWRDMLEDKSSLGNLQRMVWPWVKWEWKNFFIPLSSQLILLFHIVCYSYTDNVDRNYVVYTKKENRGQIIFNLSATFHFPRKSQLYFNSQSSNCI